MRMADREIVCRTLRQLTPDREWYYLGEAESYLLSCMVNDLRKDLVEENQRLREKLRETDAVNAENERLRELCVEMWAVIFKNNTWWDWNNGDAKRFARLLLELGIKLDGAADPTARLLREWGIEVDE